MRIGIIGTGNMGGMLARAFAADTSNHVLVHNRTARRALQLTEYASNIHLAETPHVVLQRSDIVFICTKLAEGQRLIEELGPLLTSQQTLVTTISAIPLSDMEEATFASVAKVIPSIVQSVRGGVLLVTYGPSMNNVQRESLHNLLHTISYPYTVCEDQIRVCSDLTSCGPAFLAYLLLRWAEAADYTEKVSHADAEHLLSETLIGMAKLLTAGMTLRDILQKVAVPGGVTEAGLLSLQRDCSSMFENLHQSTAAHSHSKTVANLPI